MAVTKAANVFNRQNWEESDFPILCQTCLGDNPYIRMLKDKFGKECKICQRPFSIFKWCPGARMRYKKTEICQTCSKLKNVCQTCLLDLEYGLPIQVRDHALRIQDELPKSDVNKEYHQQTVEKELAITDGTTAAGSLGKAQATSDLLLKLARTTPYYKRNRPHICSFWVKGECKRGEECPYRHEMPTDPSDPLANQNIKDRFYGVNDPVADKLLKRAATMPTLDPPSDKTITTLYVGGLDNRLTDKDLRDFFYQFGEIRSITIAQSKSCAFVCFTTRESAERAAERSFNKAIIKGKRLKILWGKSHEERGAIGEKNDDVLRLEPVPGLPRALPPPPEGAHDATLGSLPIMEPPNLFDTPAQPVLPPPPLPPHLPGFEPHVLPPPFPPPRMPPGMSFRPPGPPRHPPMGLPPRFMHPPGGFPHRPPGPPGPPPPFGRHHGPPPNFGPGRGSSVRPAVHYPSQDPQRMGTEEEAN